MKYTPAPWHISGIPTEYGREHIVSDDGMAIATVHKPAPHPGRDDSQDVLLANGSLIGRAPDMYTALKAIADMGIGNHPKPQQLLALCIAIARIEVMKVERYE